MPAFFLWESCLPAGHLSLAGSRAVPATAQRGAGSAGRGGIWPFLCVCGSSVSRFEGCYVQGMPDCQTLLSHPYSRSLCSK